MPISTPYLTSRIDPKQVQLGNAFSYFMDSPSLADTSEHPLVLVKNLTSGTTALEMVLFMRRMQARSANSCTVRTYVAPTITSAGSGATPTPRKVGGAASNMNLYTGSTIAANGTLLDLMSNFNYNASESNDCIIVVPAGTNLLLTYQASNTGAALLFGMDWFEVA